MVSSLIFEDFFYFRKEKDIVEEDKKEQLDKQKKNQEEGGLRKLRKESILGRVRGVVSLLGFNKEEVIVDFGKRRFGEVVGVEERLWVEIIGYVFSGLVVMGRKERWR